MVRRIKHLLLAGLLVFSQTIFSFAALPKQVSAVVPGFHELVSISTTGISGNGDSQISNNQKVMSGDGRYVVFDSVADNLVPNDTNGKRDIFVRDMVSGTTTRVSVASDGTQANDQSNTYRISHDGRYVVFNSNATNLVPPVQGLSTSLYRHDLVTGTTELVLKLPNGTPTNFNGQSPDISGDGRYIVFSTSASAARTLLGRNDISLDSGSVLIRDMVNGTYRLLTIDPSGNPIPGSPTGPGHATGHTPSISCDGNTIAFTSFSPYLVPGDTINQEDVFVVNLSGGFNIRNITINGNAESGGGGSWIPYVSCDGNHVAFRSSATNLVPGDTNAVDDIFKYTISDDITERVSLLSNSQQRDKTSANAFISSDGRFVGYTAAGIIDHFGTITSYPFMFDSLNGTTENVSFNSNQEMGDKGGGSVAISDDGKYAVYHSLATNLVDNDFNNKADVFRKETGIITDSVSPSVTGIPAHAPDFGDWYNSDVTIDWQATDPAPSSGTPTDPADTLANLEGENTYTSAQSCDPADNCATGSLTLKVDKSQPTVSNPTWSDNPQVEGNDTTLTVDVADSTSGVLGGEYFIGTDPGEGSGTAMTLNGNSLSATFGNDLEPGTYSVGVRSRDNAGSWSNVVTTELEITYDDNTPPAISHILSTAPNGAGWFNSPVTLTWTVEDNESPVTNQDGCDETTINQDGENTYTCTATSTGGTSSSDATVKFDATAPTFGTETWSENPVAVGDDTTLTVPVTDGISGVTNGEYFIGSDPGEGNATAMNLSSGNLSATFGSELPLGPHTVNVRAKDAADNWSEIKTVVLVVRDVTPPVVNFVLSAQPNANGWYNSNVIIDWQATDPAPSSGTPTDPANTVAGTEGQNITYMSGQSCDPAGNCATGSTQLSIDKTAPVLSNFNVGCVDFLFWDCIMFRTNVATRTFTVDAADPLSGIDRAEYYLDADPGMGNGTPMTLNGSTFTGVISSSIPSDTYMLHVRVQDKAGNWSEPVTREFIISLF
jgi:hypothetical protein